MLKEQTVELSFGDFSRTYILKQLPLAKSQEVLVKLLGLLGGAEGLSENLLAALPGRLRVEDINFFRERLFGESCLYVNESGNHVPMGKALVESHFEGRLGLMLHLIVRSIILNFADFLADLRLDDLVGAKAGE
jgi:hypothetical protein